ncbi:MAG: anti-sigma factor family protein [Candidatus Acidiferrales bacterium]
MDWNCTLTEERLSDYLEGALAAEERQACAEHSAECANCAEMLARVGELVGQMHAIELARAPAFLAHRVINKTSRARTGRHEIASASAWFNLIWQPRFAMGIATVAFTLVILAHAAGPRIGRLRPSDLNPLNLARAGNRQAHLTYARGEKFVNDLRVVYEIRAMLAAPQAGPSAPQNQTAPAPNRQRPNTGEHQDPAAGREVDARIPGFNMKWAMLHSASGETAPSAANRRTL